MRNKMFKKELDVDVALSNKSHGLVRFYVKNKVPTLFYNQTLGKLGVSAAKPCTDTLDFGIHCDPDHQFFHGSESHHPDINHYHLLKGKTHYDYFTPSEIECVLKQIKSYEKKSGLCKDGETGCTLHDTDRELIQKKYAEYYAEKQKNPDKPIKRDTSCKRLIVNSLLKEIFVTAATTLIDKYLHPYLIDRGYNRARIALTSQAIKTSMLFFLGAPLINVAADLAITQLLTPLCNFIGIELNTTNFLRFNILQRINNFYAFSNIALLEPKIINAFGVFLGEILGMMIIQELPKLRVEPAIEQRVEKEEFQTHHASLRRRSR